MNHSGICSGSAEPRTLSLPASCVEPRCKRGSGGCRTEPFPLLPASEVKWFHKGGGFRTTHNGICTTCKSGRERRRSPPSNYALVSLIIKDDPALIVKPNALLSTSPQHFPADAQRHLGSQDLSTANRELRFPTSRVI